MVEDVAKDVAKDETKDIIKNVTKDKEEENKKDQELYQRFLDGDKNALNELMIKYSKQLIYFTQKSVKDIYAAEDVSQEVFVYLMLHKEVYNFKYTFSTYLYTIAKSRANNYIKSRKRVNFISEDEERIITYPKNIEEELFKSEESMMVRDAMKKLRPEYQQVLYLVNFERLSYEEAGVVMGKSSIQIKALVHNAKKRLKVFLEEEMKEEVEHSEINGGIYK